MLWVHGVQVFVLAGPSGSGRSTLARQLLQDFNGKLAPAALLTNRCVWQPAYALANSLERCNVIVAKRADWLQLPMGYCLNIATAATA
jgi:ABC-type transporter Mla maintaining outer membrane lipid asymmetry ATPase subunit MlaF